MRISYAVPLLQHVWLWIIGGGLLVLGRVFWEPLVKMFKSLAETMEAWNKAGKAAADRRTAEATAKDAEWESQVQDMVRKIRKLKDEYRANHHRGTPDIQPSSGDNVEVFREAMRRIHREDSAMPIARSSSRFSSRF